jgi:hypothetical protein
MEKYEKIQQLEEEHNTRILTRDNIDDELDIWAEYMKGQGYSFSELCFMIQGEKYLDDDYEYYVLEQGYNYPHVEYCCDTMEELEEYFN